MHTHRQENKESKKCVSTIKYKIKVEIETSVRLTLSQTKLISLTLVFKHVNSPTKHYLQETHLNRMPKTLKEEKII